MRRAGCNPSKRWQEQNSAWSSQRVWKAAEGAGAAGEGPMQPPRTPAQPFPMQHPPTAGAGVAATRSKANPLHRSALCRGDVHLLQPQQHPAQRGEGRGGGWGAQPLAPLTKVLQTMPSTSPPPAAPLAGEPSICLQMGCFSHSSQTDSERNNDALLTKQFLCVKPSSLRFPPPPPRSPVGQLCVASYILLFLSRFKGSVFQYKRCPRSSFYLRGEM